MKNPIFGIVQKGAIKKTIKSIGLGLADSIPVINTIKQNIESNSPEKGRLDLVRIITTTASSASLLFALYLFSKGTIDFDQLNELIKNLF